MTAEIRLDIAILRAYFHINSIDNFHSDCPEGGSITAFGELPVKSFEVEIIKNPKEEDSFLHSFQIWGKAKKTLSPDFMENNQRVSILLRSPEGNALAGVAARIQFKVLYVDTLWSAPEHRGKGYGKQAYQEALTYARQNGCECAVGITYEFYDLVHIMSDFDPDLKILGKIEQAPAPHTLIVIYQKL